MGVRGDIDRAVAEVQTRLGPIWALVNNAYSAERTVVEDITDEILDGALRGCIHGSLYAMQACFPTMKEQGGRICSHRDRLPVFDNRCRVWVTDGACSRIPATVSLIRSGLSLPHLARCAR